MKNEWISVKDRLPEHEQEVLFIVNLKGGIQKLRIGKFWANPGRNKPCFTSDRSLTYVYDKKVTHWMPLPEPPNETKQQEK